MEKVLIKRHRDLRVKDGKINEIRLKTVIEKLQVRSLCFLIVRGTECISTEVFFSRFRITVMESNEADPYPGKGIKPLNTGTRNRTLKMPAKRI